MYDLKGKERKFAEFVRNSSKIYVNLDKFAKNFIDAEFVGNSPKLCNTIDLTKFFAPQ